MTVVNPKSISGINSITTGSGSDDLLTIHTNNGTERLRIDSTGATKIVTGIVTTLTATTGIVTTLTANTVTSLGAVSGTTGTFTGNVAVSGANITLQDSGGATDDRIVLGAGSDLQIYHDSNHSYIDNDNGTGNLYLKDAGAVKVRTASFGVDNADGTEAMIAATADGAVDLYHNNIKRLSTTGNGADVFGNGTTNNVFKLINTSGTSNGSHHMTLDTFNASGYWSDLKIDASNIQLNTYTGNRATLSNTALTFASGVNIAMANGNGIDFSATTNGGTMSSELLDDYEEGTWTPVLNGTHSNMGTGLGKYAKVGSITHYWIEFGHVAAGNGSFSANAYITGFPYSTPNHPPNHWTGTSSYMNSAYGMTLMTNYYNSADQFYITQAAGSLRYLWCQVSVCNF